jgi:membrane-associated phospholipid phosphatase
VPSTVAQLRSRAMGAILDESESSKGGGPLRIRRSLSVQQMLITLGVAAGLTAVTSAVAWDGDVPDWEVDVLEFLNGWPDWLEPVMWVVQQFGVVVSPIIAGLIIVYFTRNWRHLVPFVLVLPLKLGFEKGVVKQLVERERPFVSVGPRIEVRGPAFDGLSFPSGHTTTAFAVGILVSAFLPPRWRPVPLVWAAMVGVARLYYGEHNFLDIIAGAALGTAFAAILWFVFLNRYVDTASDGAGR